MDIAQIANDTLAFITPLFPYLIKGVKILGEKGAETIGKEIGKETITLAKKIWKVITPKKIVATNKINAAGKVLAQNPEDLDGKRMLENGLLDLLKENPKIAEELDALLHQRAGKQIARMDHVKEGFISLSKKGSGNQEATMENSKNSTIIINKE